MAATPNSNYFSSPSPSPTTQSTHEWWSREDDSHVYGPGLYDLEGNDEIPDITTLRVTDDQEDSFHSPPPPPQPQPKTQTPHLSSNEKRHKKMTEIANNVKPESVALAWMFMGLYVRKSSVAETLRTGLNLKPSMAEVFEIQSEIQTEFNKAMQGLINHGSYYKGGGSNLCFINFMRDMMEIPELAMIRMRKVLAECKCCALHQSRRPLCQEKKRKPDYDMFADPENDCKCSCRHFMRKLESALLGEYPLEVNGQLWERSL
jgi:hypothetical protein